MIFIVGRPGKLNAITMDLKDMKQKESEGDRVGVWTRPETRNFEDEGGEVSRGGLPSVLLFFDRRSAPPASPARRSQLSPRGPAGAIV